MNEIVERLRSLERSMSNDKGHFRLFGLFLREDAPDVWDVVVAADWLDSQSAKDVRSVADAVRKALGKSLITKISRVVILDENSPTFRAMAGSVNLEHGVAEFRNSNLFGMPIRHAFIFTSQALAA